MKETDRVIVGLMEDGAKVRLSGKGASLYLFRPQSLTTSYLSQTGQSSPASEGPQKDQRMMYLQSSPMPSSDRVQSVIEVRPTNESMRPRPCVREEATSLCMVPAVSKGRDYSQSLRFTVPIHFSLASMACETPDGQPRAERPGHRELQGPASEVRNAASCRSLSIIARRRTVNRIMRMRGMASGPVRRPGSISEWLSDELYMRKCSKDEAIVSGTR